MGHGMEQNQGPTHLLSSILFHLKALYFEDNNNAQILSHLWLFATLWTVALQAPLSMGFFRQEYWNG